MERVSARLSEEKELLASDEAVSHGLRDLQRTEIENIEKLLSRPYFARMVLEEQDARGRPHRIEYKLGNAANIDCRIVDWRHAPISGLFYEYREGEEYSELIQGREREGRILLRRKLDIRDGKLCGIVCSEGSFVRDEQGWRLRQAGEAQVGVRTTGSLPDILGLISAEQFRAITEDATSPVFIHGVAGSGKTTVALHRLSWLSRSAPEPVALEHALVLVRSPSLARYITNSLTTFSLEPVRVELFDQWALKTVARAGGWNPDTLELLNDASPRSQRVKTSSAVVSRFQEICAAYEGQPPARWMQSVLLDVFRSPRALVEADTSRLLDLEIVREVETQTRENFESGKIDRFDLGLLLLAAVRGL
ncbi:MAG: hypothetical protein KDD44_14350, partial [Bdellovibrionales bacterium]|nr:hypothetical protein [Bdellovibrionales bacterium]